MNALVFELSGKTAFFKKPDVNTFAYFTYNNVHKVALLGILGAVIGLGGYIRQSSTNLQYPEFYEKLMRLKIAVVPLVKNGCFSKKIQNFNNSVGYASKEEGGNLVVKEQWLENAAWRIYILNDGSIDKALFDKLEDCLENSKCEYMPYLGKNDHPASINNYKSVELETAEGQNHIDSLFLTKGVVTGNYTYDDELQPVQYIFKEIAPVRLNEQNNFYEYEETCLTNLIIENMEELRDIYMHNGSILAFF